MAHDLYKHIRINCNAFFYEKETITPINKELLDLLLKHGCSTTKGIRLNGDDKPIIVANQRPVNEAVLSGNIFPFNKKASCFDEGEDMDTSIWYERCVGYFFIVEYNKYVAIFKKNYDTGNTNKPYEALLKSLHPIEQQKLSSLFNDNDVNYERVSMTNVAKNQLVIRNKVLEAESLHIASSAQENIQYAIRSYRGRDSNKSFTVSLGQSRIGNIKSRVTLNSAIEWVKTVVNNMSKNNHTHEYLNSFATAIDFEKANFVPNIIRIEVQRIKSIINDIDGDTNGILTWLQNLQCEYPCTKKSEHIYEVTSIGIQLKTKKNKIDLHPPQDIAKIELDGIAFENIINELGCFSVYDDKNRIYLNGIVYEESQLRKNIDYLLKAVEGRPELNVALEEKSLTVGDKDYPTNYTYANNTIFGIVENKLIRKDECWVSDDLGDEWADHISVSRSGVRFFVEKSGDSELSASSFHIVVAQALKNIANIKADETMLNKKLQTWLQNNKNNFSDSDKYNSLIQTWKDSMHNSDFEREMCLVVNFFTKDDSLRTKLQNKTNKQAIQILSLLFSFVSICKSMGIKPIIYCKTERNDTIIDIHKQMHKKKKK